MSKYPQLVGISWSMVNAVLVDWQHEPYRWDKEIDIRVEITSAEGRALKKLVAPGLQAAVS